MRFDAVIMNPPFTQPSANGRNTSGDNLYGLRMARKAVALSNFVVLLYPRGQVIKVKDLNRFVTLTGILWDTYNADVTILRPDITNDAVQEDPAWAAVLPTMPKLRLTILTGELKANLSRITDTPVTPYPIYTASGVLAGYLTEADAKRYGYGLMHAKVRGSTSMARIVQAGEPYTTTETNYTVLGPPEDLYAFVAHYTANAAELQRRLGVGRRKALNAVMLRRLYCSGLDTPEATPYIGDNKGELK